MTRTLNAPLERIHAVSDIHLFHDKIRRKRGFDSLDQMHECLVLEWNRQVRPTDHVIVLGDLAFVKKSNVEAVQSILERMNGAWRFIKGNHDHINQWNDGMLRKMSTFGHEEMLKVLGAGRVGVKGTRDPLFIHLLHFPMMSWNRQAHGAIHLHGHLHGDRRPYEPPGGIFDVGIDHAQKLGLGLRPFSFEEIVSHLDLDSYWDSLNTNPINHHENAL